MYYVYLLRSLGYNEIYVGSTNDLQKRLKDHQGGNVLSTRQYRPWKLVYYEAYTSEKLARRREQRLKHHGSAMNGLRKRIESIPLHRQMRRQSPTRAGIYPAPLLLNNHSGDNKIHASE